MNNENEKWKPVPDDRGEITKLQTGQSIEGIVMAIEDSNKFENKIYRIKVKNDDVLKVLFGTTVLNRQMATIKEGTEVKIERKPDGQSKNGNPIQIYKVYSA